MTLWVDGSWTGDHGIGRYSREVISRLAVEYTPLPTMNGGSMLRKSMPSMGAAISRTDLVYSPGFNVRPTLAKQVITLHDLIHLRVRDESSAYKRAYYNIALRSVARRSRLIFTVSECSRRDILEWISADDVRVVNAGNGVSDEFRSTGPAWIANEPYVLYVGNMRAHKNVAVIFAALSILTNINLVVVTADVDDAHKYARVNHVEQRVTIMSGIEDAMLATLYRGSVGLVMPSTIEGFGLPAAEAIACGRPVAFTRSCEPVAEMVGRDGIAVGDASSVDEWSAAIEALSERSEIVTSGRFAWDDVASRVDKELSCLVGE